MKKYILYFWLMVLTAGCKDSKSEQQKELEKKITVQEEAVAGLVFELLQPTPEQAITEFINRFCQLDTMGASRFVVSFREHVAFYPYSQSPDTNAGSAEFVAQMYALGNKKHYFRWMSTVAEDSLTFSRIVLSGKEDKYPGYSFIKGIKVYLKKPSGEEVEFPMFDTIIKLPGGYKIWAFLDT